MPYKDKEKRKQVSRDAMKKKREGLTSGVNNEGLTFNGLQDVKMVPASFVQGTHGRTYEVLPERPRYLELSDSQVLDRANQPNGHTSGDRILRMQACNEASYNFHPNKKTRPKWEFEVKLT